MSIIISHKSALEYWRLHGNENLTHLKKLRWKSLPANNAKITELSKFIPTELSYPVDLMFASSQARPKSNIVRPSVYSGPVNDLCFLKINNDVSICSPAFCYFQMAGELSLIKLIELGYELSGSYSLAVKEVSAPSAKEVNAPSAKEVSASPAKETSAPFPQEETSTFIEKEGVPFADTNPETQYIEELDRLFSEELDYLYPERVESSPADKNTYGHPQLTNIKELKSCAARMEGVNGHKKISRALRYIVDGSASPMETKLVMILTLPHKLGGYELPPPELNKKVETGKNSSHKFGKKYYVCDLYWPEFNLAIEYDSTMYHTGADQIMNDSKKRMDLAALGIDVITVTRYQTGNIDELESLAKLIAGKLRKRLRYESANFRETQRELYNLLMKSVRFY